MSGLVDLLPQGIRGSYRENVDLSKTNWFRVGGPAEVLFKPQDINDLAYFLQNKSEEIPISILGVGSNVIIRDGGIKGVVIKLGTGFVDMKTEGSVITIGAGCLVSNLAIFAMDNAISGLEFLGTIPGTVGGALKMNAGCYGSEVSNVLVGAKAIDGKGNIIELKNEDFGFRYRGNNIPSDVVFVEATFRGEFGDKKEINAKMEENVAKREASQPVKVKTGGSTFKNPEGYSAWKLVDEAGCRGMRVGDAQISEKHCGFMLNVGNATAKDLEDLGNKVIATVKEKTGVQLEWEIKRIGEY